MKKRNNKKRITKQKLKGKQLNHREEKRFSFIEMNSPSFSILYKSEDGVFRQYVKTDKDNL